MGKGFMIQLYMKMTWKRVVKNRIYNDYVNNKKQPSQLTSYIWVVIKRWAGLLCSAFTFYISN